jgi:hypothetical protein
MGKTSALLSSSAEAVKDEFDLEELTQKLLIRSWALSSLFLPHRDGGEGWGGTSP